MICNDFCDCSSTRVVVEWTFPVSLKLNTQPIFSSPFTLPLFNYSDLTNRTRAITANDEKTRTCFCLRVITLRGGRQQLSLIYLGKRDTYVWISYVISDGKNRISTSRQYSAFIFKRYGDCYNVTFRPVRSTVYDIKVVITLVVGAEEILNCRSVKIISAGSNNVFDNSLLHAARKEILFHHYVVDDVSTFLSHLAHRNGIIKVPFEEEAVRDLQRIVEGTFTHLTSDISEFTQLCRSLALDVIADVVTRDPDKLLFVAVGRSITLNGVFNRLPAIGDDDDNDKVVRRSLFS